MQRDSEYFKQLTAEHVVTRFQKGLPIREWRKRDNDRNEALDCRVYAMSALQGLVSMGLVLNREAIRIAEAPLKNSTKDEAPLKRQKPKRRVIPSSWM